MKQVYFFAASLLFLSASATAQVGSDHPSFFNQQTVGGQTTSSTNAVKPSNGTPKVLSVTGNITPCDSGAATVIASGECSYVWATDSALTNVLSTTDTLVTDTLFNNTSYWVGSLTPTGPDSLMGLPGHGNVFGGNVRGYYFTAPTDFIITGLRVPDDGVTGDQNIEIVRFDNNVPPPLWNGTTNDFEQLGRWINFSATDTVNVCIPVDSGQVIGIYGQRGNDNSYAGAPYNTTIAGLPVTLTRSGMQQPLNTNPMNNIFSESGGSISRVEMFYTTMTDTVTTEVMVTVPQSYSGTESASICMGDSIDIGGNWYMNDTTVTTTFMNFAGCDSIVTTNLTVNMPFSATNTVTICDGDTAMINGNMYTAAGVIVDSFQTVAGCDSIFTTTLVVNAVPSVTLDPFSADTVCMQDAAFTLPVGTPAGGSYSGAGISGGDFDPSVAGDGFHIVTYTYTDSTGCAGSASSSITVEDCTGIEERVANLISIYPNPAQDFLTVDLKGNIVEQMELTDALGKVLVSKQQITGFVQLDVTNYASGIYFITVRNGNQVQTQKFVKK